jgi:hypothetical protein
MLPRQPVSIVNQLLKLVGVSASASEDEKATLPGPLAGLAKMLPASLIMQPDAMQARLPFVVSDF